MFQKRFLAFFAALGIIFNAAVAQTVVKEKEKFSQMSESIANYLKPVAAINVKVQVDSAIVNGKNIDFPETISYLDKEYYGSRHPDIIKNFYEALSTGADMPVSLVSASKVIKVILAAYKSHDKKIMI